MPLMHLLHLSPEFVDDRMLVTDFLQSCDWIDSLQQGG